MWTKEIVVCNKECNMVIGAFSTAIAIGYLIGKLECSVKTLNDLLQPAIFLGDRILIRKADDLNQVEVHILQHKLLLCKFVGSITISSKLQSLARELFEL